MDFQSQATLGGILGNDFRADDRSRKTPKSPTSRSYSKLVAVYVQVRLGRSCTRIQGGLWKQPYVLKDRGQDQGQYTKMRLLWQRNANDNNRGLLIIDACIVFTG